MALDSFSNLKAAVQNWMDRSDVAGQAEDFITLAEGHFNLELRTREMVTESTGNTPTSGAITLPTDFLQTVRVVADTSPPRELSYIPPQVASRNYDNTAGLPSEYTIIGSSLKTYPLSTQDIDLVYYQSIPALTDSNTSNWLLAKYPNLYLTACLMEAARYFRDEEEFMVQAKRANAQITRLNSSEMVAVYAASSRSFSEAAP